MLPKNLIPEEPPGIDPINIHNNATTCNTANMMVSNVLCRCSAQYSVPINVDPYNAVGSARSFVNNDFTCAQGPYRKLKLNTFVD